MFKRVERKRKRREEEEELNLDDETKGIMGLNDTDSDESGSSSGSEHGSAQSDDLVADVGEEGERQGDTLSEDEAFDSEDPPPVSIAEALKDPLYLISVNPTIHGCVLCKGKLVKNAGMATAHKNSNAHKRRFEHFQLLSVDADSRSNAWELIRASRSASKAQTAGLQELSKRALKRQAKREAIREKRNRHKKLKAKAIAKKTLNKLSPAYEARPPVASTKVKQRGSSVLEDQRGKAKRLKTESKTTISSIVGTREVVTKSTLRTKILSGNKESVLKSGFKSTRKTSKSS